MAFSETRDHKHIQRFNPTELRFLDTEVDRLKKIDAYKKMTRTKIIRVALDLYFELSCHNREAAHEEPVAPVLHQPKPKENKT